MKTAMIFSIAILASSAALANVAHNALLRRNAADQQKVLSRIVISSGHACTGAIDANFKFIEPKSDYAYWRVHCGSAAYLVEIQNDEAGSTKVLDCSKTKSMKIDCE